MQNYTINKITLETYVATCGVCKKPFRSDDKEKAIRKVESHIRDKHG